MSTVIVVVLAVLASSCAMMPASKARIRSQAVSEMRPITAYEPLLQLHAALLKTEGVELEQQAIITRWIALGVKTLRGDDPSTWEAVARPGWPQVRSLLGPYETLEPFAATFDKLLQ